MNRCRESNVAGQRRRRLHDVWSGCRGTTAVEFALVATPLIWIVGVLCETGAFLLIQYQLQYATERAARLLRTNQIAASTQVDQFKATICSQINIPNCTKNISVDVRHASTFAALNPAEIAYIGPPQNSGVFEPGSNGEVGSVFVTYDWKFIFPFMSTAFGFGNVPGRNDIRRLHANAIFMHELT